MAASGPPSLSFPAASPALEAFGLKFSPGGAHISRTMMLQELGAVLANVPQGSVADAHREAIIQRNVLGKGTDSTRQKSLRHLRELYALDEATPIFGLLRKLHTLDAGSLALLAVLVAWARDPLFRATTRPVMDAIDRTFEPPPRSLAEESTLGREADQATSAASAPSDSVPASVSSPES